MGRSDSILDQFEEIARCRDAQHGDGVCCALAPQLVSLSSNDSSNDSRSPVTRIFITALRALCKLN